MRLETFANVAVLLTCLVVTGVALLRSNNQAPARPESPSYEVGEELTELKDQPVSSDKTLVLFLRSSCRYCTESMETYRRFAAERKSSAGFRIAVVSTEPQESLSQYLERHNLSVDSSLSHPSTKVRSTPVAVVIDRNRRVLGAWRGVLGDRESEVRELLNRSE